MVKIILTVLLFILIISSIVDTKDNESIKQMLSHDKDNREDYGCLHKDHSQYEDGDGLNLEAANYVLHN